MDTKAENLVNTVSLDHRPQDATDDEALRKKQERRLRLLRQSGHLGNDRSGAVYTQATDVRDLENAFRLVHDIYVEMGYIPRQKNGLRMRHFEFCSETATFVARTASHSIIGAISVIQDSPDFGLPSDYVFKQEIDEFRKEGRRVCEMSNQAVLKEFRRLGPAGELMRCAWAFAVANDQTDVICAVSPQLVSLYETICFEQVGPKKSYSDSVDDEVVLMRMPDIQYRPSDPRYHSDAIYKQLIDYYYLENPHLGNMSIWRMLNQQMFSEEFGMASLLGKCPEILLNHAVSESLHRRLGNIFELSQLALEKKSDFRACRKVRWTGDSDALKAEKTAQSHFGDHVGLYLSASRPKTRGRSNVPAARRTSRLPKQPKRRTKT